MSTMESEKFLAEQGDLHKMTARDTTKCDFLRVTNQRDQQSRLVTFFVSKYRFYGARPALSPPKIYTKSLFFLFFCQQCLCYRFVFDVKMTTGVGLGPLSNNQNPTSFLETTRKMHIPVSVSNINVNNKNITWNNILLGKIFDGKIYPIFRKTWAFLPQQKCACTHRRTSHFWCFCFQTWTEVFNWFVPLCDKKNRGSDVGPWNKNTASFIRIGILWHKQTMRGEHVLLMDKL